MSIRAYRISLREPAHGYHRATPRGAECSIHHEIPQHNRAPLRRVGLLANIPFGARANGLEPYVYLRYVEDLPLADTVQAREPLLPWNVKSLLKAHHACE